MSKDITQETLARMLADEMQEKSGAAVKHAVESVFAEFWRDLVDSGVEKNGLAIHLEVRRDGADAGEAEVMSVQWLPRHKKKATDFPCLRAEPAQLQIDFEAKADEQDEGQEEDDGADFLRLRHVARSLHRDIVYCCGLPEGKVGKWSTAYVTAREVPIPDGMEEKLLKDMAKCGAIVVNRFGHLTKETVKSLLESDVNVAVRIGDGVWHYVLDEAQPDGVRAAPGSPAAIDPKGDWCEEGPYRKFA